MRLLAMLWVICLAGCSGSSDVCSAATCGGCCTAAGVCETGLTVSACGEGGVACTACGGGAQCVSSHCTAACTPTTCAALGATCGQVPDGCGGVLACGSCTGGKVCGGGGVANVCGDGSCTSTTCAALGKSCGVISDGCSSTIDCGTCGAGTTCGGSGVPNVCGIPTGGTGGGSGTGGGTSSGGGSGTGGSSGGSAGPCVCPAGYSCSSGACRGGNAENLTLDVLSPNVISVGGTVQYNGAAPISEVPSTACATLKLTRADRKFSASLPVECNAAGNVSFSGRVVAGVYDVELSSGSSLRVPQLPFRLSAVDFSTSRLNMVLAFTGPAMVHVTGKVLRNGARPALATPPTCGFLRFLHQGDPKETVARVSCQSTGDFTFEVDLAPGPTTIKLQETSLGGDLTSQTLPGTYTIAAGMGPLTLDTKGLTLSGAITLNTKAPSLFTGYKRVGVELKSTTTGGQVLRILASGANYTVNALPGTYDVSVLVEVTDSVAPIRVVVFPSRSLTASTTLNLDATLSTTPIGTTLKHNGASLGSECYFVRFTSLTDGSSYSFGCPMYGTTVSRVTPGSYRVDVDGVGDGTLPPGTWPAGNFTIPASTAVVQLNLGVTTPGLALASFQVRHNGAAPVVFPPQGSNCGRLLITPAGMTDTAWQPGFSCASSGGFTVSNLRLTRGTYSVSVLGDQLSSSLPNTAKLVAPSLVIASAAPSTVLDVMTPPMARVSGRVLSNGTSPLVLQSSATCGEVVFENTNGVDHQRLPLQCGSAAQLTFQGVVVSGTYRVSVRGDMNEVLLPPDPVVVVDALVVP
ncbi:MAG: hypothetical protein IPJ65_29575 [Archangiaceae bacterium]|nr:hypothetical protein [Archangiaceae bacterium]